MTTHFSAYRNATATATALAAALALSLAPAAPALASGTNTWQASGGTLDGDWNDATRWSEGFVPGTVGHTDDDVIITNVGNVHTSGPYLISLDHTMLTGNALTLRSYQGLGSTASAQYTAILGVEGALGNRIDMQLGEVGDNPANAITLTRGARVDLVHTDLSFVGTTGSHAINLNGGDLNTTNSTINISGGNVGANLGVTLGNSTSTLTMNGGSLTVTNTTNNARIFLNSGDLAMHDALLTANALAVQSGSQFTFNNTAGGTSNVSGQLYIYNNAQATFQAGAVNLQSAHLDLLTTGGSNRLNVTGGHVAISQNLVINNNSTNDGAAQKMADVSAGSLSAANALIGGGSSLGTRGNYLLRIRDTGSVTLSGTLTLGYTLNSGGRHGSGLLDMTGGTFQAAHVVVGTDNATDSDANGYYSQTGGHATITGSLLLRPTTTTGYGAREFKVTGDATLTFTGTGFNTAVLSTVDDPADWLIDADDWDTTGTLIFDPAAAIVQNLLAFGSDLGADEAGFAAAFDLGTLDVSGIDAAGEKLLVTGAGNAEFNALYINKLLGLNTTLNGGVLAYLDSELNLYYDATQAANAYLGAQTYDLASGGQLIAIPVPEPASLALLGMGSLLMVRRRRSAV